MKILLTNLRIPADKLREVNYDSVDFKHMVDSVSNFGIIAAITVAPYVNEEGHVEEGVFSIQDGLHRFSAATEAGLSEIDCTIREGDSDVDTMLLQIVGNNSKITTQPCAYGKQLNRVAERRPEMTRSELASAISVSVEWLNKIMKLDKAFESQGIKDLIDSGAIKISNAVTLSKLPPAEQENYLESAQLSGAEDFAIEVGARVKVLKEEQQQARKGIVIEFRPQERLRKMSELKLAIGDDTLIADLASGLTPEEALKMGIKYSIQMDDISLVKQREKYDNDKETKAAASASRAAQKKAEAAAKATALADKAREDAPAAA